MKNNLPFYILMMLSFLFPNQLYPQTNSIENGKLAIGTHTPSARLDINSDAGEDGLRVRINSATKLRVLSQGGVTIGGNPPGGAPSNGLYVSGNTGLGHTSAAERLVIKGAVTLAGNASSNNPQRGTIRWNDSTSDFEGYDGTNWKSLTGQPNTNQTTYNIGDYAQGGIVVWTTPDNLHGKVVYLYELGPEDYSNLTSDASGAISTTNGQNNTQIIIDQTGHTSSAALLCYNLVANGYNDWYLPAREELFQIYQTTPNTTLIDNALKAWGGDGVKGDKEYGTSTELSSYQYQSIRYYSSPPAISFPTKFKHNPLLVRAYREF